jgi:hypothetical protein
VFKKILNRRRNLAKLFNRRQIGRRELAPKRVTFFRFRVRGKNVKPVSLRYLQDTEDTKISHQWHYKLQTMAKWQANKTKTREILCQDLCFSI